MSKLTEAVFSMQCSFIAKNAAAWAADILTLPEHYNREADAKTVARFTDEMRARLDRLDEWAGRCASPVKVERPSVKEEPNLRYEWDGIAGKMRYFGSSAPNGWIGDEKASHVSVKPLEWFEHPNAFPAPMWSAQTGFGFYNIEEVSASDTPAYEVRLHAHHLVAVKDSLEEAKEASQADYETRIRSALEAPAPVKGETEGWRPIETAPKDGTEVLLFCVPNEVHSLKPHIAAGYWHKTSGIMAPGVWRLLHGVGPSFEPTHWMSLPASPEQGRER